MHSVKTATNPRRATSLVRPKMRNRAGLAESDAPLSFDMIDSYSFCAVVPATGY